MRNHIRNVALVGPTIGLFAAIATQQKTSAYPGDVFTAGSPT